MTAMARVANTHIYRANEDREDWIIVVFPGESPDETLLVHTIDRQDKTYTRDVEGSIALRRSLILPIPEGEQLP